MSDDMTISDYLAQGGKLTSPANVPPRYRAELMRMMASFVDSELAGAAGFADVINDGPGVKERIAAARIVMEKTDHADQILQLMGTFGANTDRYATYHPWTDRLPRDADVDVERNSPDMRLAVFNYPLVGWVDAVTMNFLMGTAVDVQLSEYTQMSYQPMAEAMRTIAVTERRHTSLAREGLEKLGTQADQRSEIQRCLTYWWPRVASSFGSETSGRFSNLRSMGLRTIDNGDLRVCWEKRAAKGLQQLGYTWLAQNRCI